MFLRNKNIIFKIRRSKVTDYAALTLGETIHKRTSAFVISWITFEASSTNSADPDQTAPVGKVRSGSTLFNLFTYKLSR